MAEAGQPLFGLPGEHAPHTPAAVMQTGLAAGQSELAMHSTHPSDGLHCSPPGHAVFPLTPQSALPAVRLEPLLPLHAIAAATRAASVAPKIPAPLPLPLLPLVVRMR